jgi:hypothetical protein
MAASGVRRDKAALSSGCKAHPATAPAGSNRSRHGGDEMSDDDIYFFVRRHGRPHGANSSNVLYSTLHRNTADLA